MSKEAFEACSRLLVKLHALTSSDHYSDDEADALVDEMIGLVDKMTEQENREIEELSDVLFKNGEKEKGAYK